MIRGRKAGKGTFMSPEINTQTAVLPRQAIGMRFLRDSYKAWCEECCEVVLALELESAARFMHIPFKTLGDLFATGKLHVVEPGSRSLLVCGTSILKIDGQDLQG